MLRLCKLRRMNPVRRNRFGIRARHERSTARGSQNRDSGRPEESHASRLPAARHASQSAKGLRITGIDGSIPAGVAKRRNALHAPSSARTYLE